MLRKTPPRWLWLVAAAVTLVEARFEATRLIHLSAREFLQPTQHSRLPELLYAPLNYTTCANHLCTKHLVSVHDAWPTIQPDFLTHQVGNNTHVNGGITQHRSRDDRITHDGRRLRQFTRRVHGPRLFGGSTQILRDRRAAGTDGNQRLVSTAGRLSFTFGCSGPLDILAVNKQALVRMRRRRTFGANLRRSTSSQPRHRRARVIAPRRRDPRADLLLQAQS